MANSIAAQRVNGLADLLLNNPVTSAVLDGIAANPAFVGLEMLAGALSNAIAPLKETLLVRVLATSQLHSQCAVLVTAPCLQI